VQDSEPQTPSLSGLAIARIGVERGECGTGEGGLKYSTEAPFIEMSVRASRRDLRGQGTAESPVPDSKMV